MTHRLRFTTLFLMVVAATPVHGQSVAGKWAAMFDSDITTYKDTVVVKARQPARLVLSQHGDSVVGFWVNRMDSVEVRGTFDGRTLRMSTGVREREIKVNGQSTRMKVRTDWTASLQGSGLAGTMLINIGDRPAPARRWEATKG